jgi:hypothetical protein
MPCKHAHQTNRMPTTFETLNQPQPGSWGPKRHTTPSENATIHQYVLIQHELCSELLILRFSALVVTMCMIMPPAAAARTHEHLSHAWLSFFTPGALGHPAQSVK